jgi:acyl-CoA reductase-like NAD-dependent aldehyde dehydrogenase
MSAPFFMSYIEVMREYPMWVDGKALQSDRMYELRLPYDSSITARVAEGGDASFEAACAAAGEGARAMADLTNAERSDLLLRAAALLKRDAAEFSELLTLETGKPIKEARVEADRGQRTLIASAIAARELAGEAIPIDAAPVGKGRMAMTLREPLGIIGAITPFNLPLNLALHKVGPALAGGNAVVHKPAELTPLTAVRLAQLFTEAGAPSGAYNVITGDGPSIGRRLVADPRIRMITFTGSVEVGKEIRTNAGLKRVTLELGGNAGLIVDRGADLDLAVERAVPGSFLYSGQICISIQRIYAHHEIAAEFTRKFVAATQKLRIGHPLDDATDIASLISEAEAERVVSWIQDAVSKGATLLTGGERTNATVTPAVLANLPKSARMACSEVFGPVVSINAFDDLDAAIDEVNGTPYGLQAGIFTQNLSRAFHAAKRLQAGGVMINDIPGFRADNMPYGGVKESGMGREGPRYAIEEMTETKLICWR